MKKKLVSLLMVFLCVLLAAAAAGAEESDLPASGTLGDNIAWTLSEEGKLTITGSGVMEGNFYEAWKGEKYRDSIREVVIGEGITNSGDFGYCRNLTKVSLPSSVTVIDGGAFNECRALKEIVLPEGVVSIGLQAFRFCKSLESINFPQTLKTIDAYAFCFCGSLAEISSGDLPLKEYTRIYEGELFTFSLPANVETVGYCAFEDTELIGKGKNLKRFWMPMTTIGKGAFAGMNAESVYLQETSSGIEIGSRAFADCRKLRYFVVESWDDGYPFHIAEDAFAGCREDLVLVGTEWDDRLKTYAEQNGFRYMENEIYPGDG